MRFTTPPRPRAARRARSSGRRRSGRCCRSSRRGSPRATVFGLAARSAVAETIWPGVQKPHCRPSSSMKARWSGLRPSGERPSIVTTLRPSTAPASTRHELTATPSSSTAQARRRPRHSRASCRSARGRRAARSTSRRVGSMSSSWCSPLTSTPIRTRESLRVQDCRGRVHGPLLELRFASVDALRDALAAERYLADLPLCTALFVALELGAAAAARGRGGRRQDRAREGARRGRPARA